MMHPPKLIAGLIEARTLLLLALAQSAGCAPERRAAVHPAATWTVAGQPTARIGEEDLPAGHEFSGIVSARRLPDGRFLIANSGALELALFDSSGKFVKSIGRKGAGPGEFAATVSLFAATADSLAVFDGGNQRWSIFSPAPAFSRSFPTSDPHPPHPVWVHRGVLVTQASLEDAAPWILPILDTLRAADPEVTRLIEARIDDAGALWVRDAGNPAAWDIYTGPGAAAGRVMLPPGLGVLQLGPDFILGVAVDTVGLETVALYPLARTAAAERVNAVPSGLQSHSELPADPTLKGQFARAVMMAQEGYYSDHNSYTGHVDSLEFSIDPPARLFLLYGDNRHWAGVVVRFKTLATCGVSVGFPSPAGWEDGAPLCDR